MGDAQSGELFAQPYSFNAIENTLNGRGKSRSAQAQFLSEI
jgi:hypothetical protein